MKTTLLKITNLCHMRMVEVSRAVTVTWKYSSVLTPNHSGESRNWFSLTRCRARPPWETINLTTVGTVSSTIEWKLSPALSFSLFKGNGLELKSAE